MAYTVKSKVFSTTSIKEFEQFISEFESELQSDDSVYEYHTQTKVNTVNYEYVNLGTSEELLTYTVIYRIYYEEVQEEQ